MQALSLECFWPNSLSVTAMGRNGPWKTVKKDAITQVILPRNQELCLNRLRSPSSSTPKPWRGSSKILEVDIEHVKSVLLTSGPSSPWKDEILSQRERSKRDDPFPIFLAKEAVKTVSQRYREQSEHLKDALAVGSKIFQGESLEPLEGDHPLYAEIKKDLGTRRS
jgi:hypothetical protein